MSERYTKLASIYDDMMSDYDYEYSLSLIASYAHGKGLDLGCGSGKFTIALANMGMDMVGVDASLDMLAVAVERSRQAGKRITYVEQDLTDVDICANRYSLVTATCDVFNYILEEETLLHIFTKIRASLVEGGVLAFDLSSREKLTSMTIEGQYVYDTEDLTYIWTNTLDGDVVDMDVTFFKRDGERYVRFDEYHTQRIYDISLIRDMLERAGYRDIQCIDKGDRYYFISKV